MKNNPLVTVIIPTYNSEAYITDAIESVLSQTYQNFEIIVVDDGSKDRTKERVEPYKARIRFIMKHNGGPASARNMGLKEAKGEFVAFLDSDDIWLPTKLEKQLAVMLENPAVGLVACSEYEVDPKKKVVGGVDYKNPGNMEQFRKRMLVGNGIGGGSTAVIRRECFNKVGIFDEDLRGTEDWDMWLKVALHYEVRFIEERLIQARIRPNSVSSLDNSEKMLNNEIKLLDKLYANTKYSFSGRQRSKSYAYRYFSAAKSHKNSGRFKEARAYLKKAIRLYPLLFLTKDGFKVSLILLGKSL